jgi:hypothetical protein
MRGSISMGMKKRRELISVDKKREELIQGMKRRDEHISGVEKGGAYLRGMKEWMKGHISRVEKKEEVQEEKERLF